MGVLSLHHGGGAGDAEAGAPTAAGVDQDRVDQDEVDRDATDRGGPGRSGDPTGTPNTLDELRRKMAVLSGMPDRPAVPPVGGEVLPVPFAVSDLLPGNGISRGSVVSYRGARSLLMAMIATVTQAGHQVGIIGMPRLNLLAAVEMGADLARIAVVPDPGIDPVEVASVLLDGMDLVVLGMKGGDVAPARCRVVGGRARAQSSSLVVVDGGWSGVHTRIDARVIRYLHGPRIADRQGADPQDADLSTAHRGHGRVGGMRLRVSAHGRDGRSRSADIDVRAGGFGEDRIRMTRVSSAGASGGSRSGAFDGSAITHAVAN